MKLRTRAYLETHVAVVLFGFTAILGVWIDMAALSMVMWRVLVASLGYLVLVHVSRLRAMSRSAWWSALGNGGVIAFHWLCFYGSIKLANASVALVCLATASFFTSILEPWITGSRRRWSDMLFGLLIVPAMYLVVEGVDRSMWLGVWVGLVSALGAALFSSWNKSLVSRIDPLELSLVEMVGATLVLIPAVVMYGTVVDDFQWIPRGMDWLYIGIWALLCTNLAFLLSVRALRYISAFESNLIINLEPVYGILLAFLILREDQQMGFGFYIGAAIILMVIFLHRVFQRRHKG